MKPFDARVLAGPERANRERALQVMAAALAAVDPEEAVRRHVALQGDVLRVAEREYDLRRYRRVLIVGGGKASAAMAVPLEQMLGPRLAAGLINVKDGYGRDLRRVRVVEAGHPVPDARGVAATGEMLDLLAGTGEDDLVVALLSGGGSALLPAPVEGVTLADLQAVTGLLLRCGAAIGEINAVRKHLSRMAGGQLARVAAPATVVALLISDVVGSPLDVIASGPTVPDTSTYAEAWSVLERYGVLDQAPVPVVQHLQRGRQGELSETPKPGDPVLAAVQNVVVASNLLAAEAAVDSARGLGLNALLLSTYVEGEAREVGRVLAGVAREIVASEQPVARPACIVAGGETTVTVRGQGKGGRNQEVPLGAAAAVSGLDGVLIAGLATDGSDGPTDAAGALVDGSTVARARALGLDPYAALAQNDAYHFFQALGDLLVTGPTCTNVNDLSFVFVF